MNQIIQNVVSTNVLLATFSNCFTNNILLTSEFKTVTLLYTNKSADLASGIHREILITTMFAWNVYNMDINSTSILQKSSSKIYEKMFFILVLDNLTELDDTVYNYLVLSRLQVYNERTIVLVEEKPCVHMLIRFVSRACREAELFSAAFIFWENPIQFYICRGYDYKVLKPTFENSTCPNDIAERLYYDKMIDMKGLEFNVLTLTNPPAVVRTIGRNENGDMAKNIDGVDVMISNQIGKVFNFTFKFVIATRSVRFVGSKVSSARSVILNGYAEVIRSPDSFAEQPVHLPTVREYDIVQCINSDCDAFYREFFSNKLFDMEAESPDFSNYMLSLKQSGIRFLYPHDTEVNVIIVPKYLKSQLQLENLFKSPLFSVWFTLIVIISIIRLLLARLTKSVVKIADVFMDTFGLSLGKSTEVEVYNASENVLTWFFCLSTMLSGIILSTFLFQGFALNDEVPTINSLDDLRQSKLKIQAPTYIYNIQLFFEEYNITNTILSYETDITTMVISGDTRFAYVIRMSKFQALVKNKKMWNIIYHFGEDHVGYKTFICNPLMRRFNIVIQRFVEHGIVAYFKEESKRIWRSEDQQSDKLIADTVSSVSVYDVQDTFLILLFGLLLAIVSFLIERLIFSRRPNLH